MNEHFIDQSYAISILALCATFEQACDINNIHEEANMWNLRFVVKNTPAATANSHMIAAAYITTVVVLINNTTEPLT